MQPRILALLLGLAGLITIAPAQDARTVPLAPPHTNPADRPPSVDYAASRARGTPRYPPQALSRRQSGSVLLKIRVDANGKAAAVEVEQGAGQKYFDDAAVDAVRQWVFQPGLKNGRPISAWLLLPIEFTPPAIALKH